LSYPLESQTDLGGALTIHLSASVNVQRSNRLTYRGRTDGSSQKKWFEDARVFLFAQDTMTHNRQHRRIFNLRSYRKS